MYAEVLCAHSLCRVVLPSYNSVLLCMYRPHWWTSRLMGLSTDHYINHILAQHCILAFGTEESILPHLFF